MRNRRALLALAPVALLPACGFHLRGLPEFGFASLYIEAPSGSPLAQQLQRALEGAGTKLLVLREPAALASAQAILDLLQEQQERVVVGLSAAGQVLKGSNRAGKRDRRSPAVPRHADRPGAAVDAPPGGRQALLKQDLGARSGAARPPMHSRCAAEVRPRPSSGDWNASTLPQMSIHPCKHPHRHPQRPNHPTPWRIWWPSAKQPVQRAASK